MQSAYSRRSRNTKEHCCPSRARPLRAKSCPFGEQRIQSYLYLLRYTSCRTAVDALFSNNAYFYSGRLDCTYVVATGHHPMACTEKTRFPSLLRSIGFVGTENATIRGEAPVPQQREAAARRDSAAGVRWGGENHPAGHASGRARPASPPECRV